MATKLTGIDDALIANNMRPLHEWLTTSRVSEILGISSQRLRHMAREQLGKPRGDKPLMSQTHLIYINTPLGFIFEPDSVLLEKSRRRKETDRTNSPRSFHINEDGERIRLDTGYKAGTS